MSRVSKVLSLTVLLAFLLACNFVTQPVRDVQNIAETAQSVVTQIPVETLQAFPTVIASVVSEETIQALPSAMPTLEGIASALPDFGNMFDPQGTPVQEWRGIPVMPQATAGQEFSENNTYSFKITGTTKDVQDFYAAQLTPLGWNQPFSIPVEEQGGLLTFSKDDSTLVVTITASEGSVIVLLTMAQ